MRRAVQAIHETAKELAARSGWTPPDPRPGIAFELRGCRWVT